MILVNQTTGRKLGRNAQTSYANVFSWLLLQREHLFRKVCAHESLVVSVDVLQGRGEYDHIERVEHASELVDCFCLRLVLGDVGPIRDHELVRDPAVEDEARVAQHPGEVLVQLVVGNPIRVTAVPVSRNIDRKNNFSHRPPHFTLNKVRRFIEVHEVDSVAGVLVLANSLPLRSTLGCSVITIDRARTLSGD